MRFLTTMPRHPPKRWRELSSPLICVRFVNPSLRAPGSLLRDALRPSCRLLLTMRFDDGLSAAEIATILKYPSQFHVYRRINALLADLRSRLEKRGYEHAAS